MFRGKCILRDNAFFRDHVGSTIPTEFALTSVLLGIGFFGSRRTATRSVQQIFMEFEKRYRAKHVQGRGVEETKNTVTSVFMEFEKWYCAREGSKYLHGV